MEMPEGWIITPKEAPDIDDLFDELRIATGAGSLHRVVAPATSMRVSFSFRGWELWAGRETC